ncbi:type IV secretion system protein [Wolbachia endosymbiont (group B) of Limnophora tigrina]|uniref:type IV secretion system protein n=1 Tax=Wolbachia endosymbiont (group B) of Limnophora tigrina TaxID=3139317 RepID=UPI0035B56D3C
MMSKRSLLLILYLAITGCTMDCVEPGLQSRNTSVNVDVPVHKADEGVKIHWVDSGQVISQGEKIKFTLGGSVNFCPSKEGENPRKILVPAVFCADGSIPNYSSELINNSGLDERKACGDIGFGNKNAYSRRRYVDTGIKVDPGDKLSFSLVPREMTIDYDNPEGKGISFDDNCYDTQEGNEKATVKDMLNGRGFFCGDKGKRTAVEFPQLSKEKMEKRKALVGNGYTPYDNKVHFNQYYIQDNKPWMHGSLLDLRRAKIGLNELCDGKTCDPNETKKYSSYELNCYYQNICYNKEGIWNAIFPKEKNCVSSIRYKRYDKDNKCDMYSHLKEVEDKLKKIAENKGDFKQVNIGFISNTKKDTEDLSWAEALVAKIGDLDDQDTAEGTQCLPEKKGAKGDNVCSQISDNFEHFSLKLNHDYTIDEKDVAPGSNVMLAIADYGNYGANRGGYHVKVTRSCEYINGKKLYVYLGDEPPKDLHSVGTNDFKVVGVRVNGKDEYTILDVISGKHFRNEESKKIYFGIDVSNVERDDITDKNGKYYENNKYTVTLFVKRKINDFISSNINEIFDFITGAFKSGVKDSYEGYRRGLLQGVRALLTLYVIFTVVGYMLGTIQLSKFDFIVRMMKIAFIAFAFSDKSWEFFGTTLSILFVDSSTYLVDSFSGYIGEGGRKFAFLDLTAGVLFTAETWLKFLSLMLSGPFGFIAFLAILYATFAFLKCIISATFKYVISTVLVAFLLSLTPLFIVFILFQQTKPLFDNWIKTLAHVAVQPVILFSSLSLLNQLMYSVLYNLTNFSVCYQCLISVNFLSYDLCLMKSILPLGYSPGTNVDVALSTGERAGGHFAALPIDLIQAFMYLIIASAMESFVSISEAMAQALFSSGWGVAGSVGQVATSASQSILSAVGLDNKTQGMIQNIRQQVGKDRTEVDVKDNSMSPKSEIPEQSGKQEGPDKKERGSSKPEAPKQSGQQKNPDETIRSDPSDKAKNKEGNGEK